MLNTLCFGQINVDSIKLEIKNASHDTTLINSYRYWERGIKRTDPNLSTEINLKIDSICKSNLTKEQNPIVEKRFKELQADNNLLLGSDQSSKGDYDGALSYLYQAVQTYRSLKDQGKIAKTLNVIGEVNRKLGNYTEAMDFYSQSLEISETINDTNALLGAIGGIGVLHFRLEEYEIAIDYFKRSKAISVIRDNQSNIASMNSNIGAMYMSMDELDSARIYFEESLTVRRELNDVNGIMGSCVNLGLLEQWSGNYPESLVYLKEAEKISQETNNEYGLSLCYVNLSRTYSDMKSYDLAIDYGNKALEISQKLKSIAEIQEAYRALYRTYKEMGNYKEALYNYEEFNTIKDSLTKEDNKDQIAKKSAEYEYEKQRLADSLAVAQQQELSELDHEAALEKATQRQYALGGGMILVLALGIVALIGYRRKKRDNLIITAQKEEVEAQKFKVEQQKEIIEQAHKEITDSISYAKRIQDAILPSEAFFREIFGQSFVIYEPKDVVAGDFYWLQKLDDEILFAVADCTGHGVPGAMVSVICNNALNKSVKEYNLKNPADILNKTREIVISELAKSGNEVNDGMDIALCALSENQLQFAGAHNSLWLLSDNELKIVKGDKQPVGKFDQSVPFTTHKIELKENDTIYLFSDGFVDQFGGEKGKKLKASTLKQLILTVNGLSLDQQREFLLNNFNTWKGELEQVDDVCMIGIKFSNIS